MVAWDAKWAGDPDLDAPVTAGDQLSAARSQACAKLVYELPSFGHPPKGNSVVTPRSGLSTDGGEVSEKMAVALLGILFSESENHAMAAWGYFTEDIPFGPAAEDNVFWTATLGQGGVPRRFLQDLAEGSFRAELEVPLRWGNTLGEPHSDSPHPKRVDLCLWSPSQGPGTALLAIEAKVGAGEFGSIEVPFGAPKVRLPQPAAYALAMAIQPDHRLTNATIVMATLTGEKAPHDWRSDIPDFYRDAVEDRIGLGRPGNWAGLLECLLQVRPVDPLAGRLLDRLRATLSTSVPSSQVAPGATI